jgi:hypothetical protein
MASEDISEALGMEPRFSWTAGQVRLGADGREIGGVNEKTYWSCRIAVAPCANLVDALGASLSELESRKRFLRTFVETGGEVEFFIGWFTKATSGGEMFDWELLKRLADLRIGLSFDVYGNRA